MPPKKGSKKQSKTLDIVRETTIEDTKEETKFDNTEDQEQKEISKNQMEETEVLNHKNKVLKDSGVQEAYEYFLRKLCKEGFPNGNIYEYAAFQVEKFEKKQNAEKLRKATLKNSIDEISMTQRMRVQYGLQEDSKIQEPQMQEEKKSNKIQIKKK